VRVCASIREVHPEFYTLAQSYAAAKQSKIDTRDGLDIVFGLVDFDANQEVYGLVRRDWGSMTLAWHNN
jgi:hypothetical protein